MGSGLPANCLNLAGVGYPEDITHSDGTTASTVASDTAMFSVFMQFLDQPTPPLPRREEQPRSLMGRKLFSAIGCAICHTPSLTTQASHLTPGLSNATANLFSDIEIHHMGVGLRTMSPRAALVEINSARLHCGPRQRIFSCTMAVRQFIVRNRGSPEQRIRKPLWLKRPLICFHPAAAGSPELPALAVIFYSNLPGETRKRLARSSLLETPGLNMHSRFSRSLVLLGFSISLLARAQGNPQSGGDFSNNPQPNALRWMSFWSKAPGPVPAIR